jgi:hypothetical protein
VLKTPPSQSRKTLGESTKKIKLYEQTTDNYIICFRFLM